MNAFALLFPLFGRARSVVSLVPRWGLAFGCVVLGGLGSGARAATPLEAARAMVARIVPNHAGQIDVQLTPVAADARDAFEVETVKGRLVLRGSNGVCIGSALNWYLEHIAHCQVSWNGDNLALPATLPSMPQVVRISSPYERRVYFNYCTFNYTASWWDRARWEREIDWMALHGINTPLAITGQEAVWQATLRRFKMTEDEIHRFLAGPAYLAWQWMTNMEQWGGPLPQTWIDSHVALGKFILERERSLGMTPILQGFTGCVPLAIADAYPQARIQKKKIWCEVGPGTAQLDPQDPLFAQMGRAFLEEQTKLFGTDHLYAGDPFHEGEPPIDTPEYLHDVGARLYQVTSDFDPEATIVMQGWTIREGIVKGIPAERLLALDLTGQKWRETQTFWGRPWVAGIIHNYGGRHYLGGNLPQLAANAPTLLNNREKGRAIVGIGLFPEAIEQNPLLYSLAAELGWMNSTPDLSAWVRTYVLSRYGRDVPVAQQAWARLLRSVYSQKSPEPPMESPLQGRPALTLTMASPWGTFDRDYDQMQVWTAWRELLSAAPQLGGVDPYRYDLIDVARQALADLSVPLHHDIKAAWISGDRPRLEKAEARFLELGADLDRLLGTRRDFMLGPWLAGARNWGTTDLERDQFERNARQLLTIWGPPVPSAYIFDYACRQWSGMLSGFYLPRWQKFFGYLATQPASYRDDDLKRASGRPANDANEFYHAMAEWESQWCQGHETYPTTPKGDSVEVARELYAKWNAAAAEQLSRPETAPRPGT